MPIQQQKLNKLEKNEWISYPIQFSDRQSSIKHWTTKNNKDEIFSYDKYSKKIELLQFSDEEYELYL